MFGQSTRRLLLWCSSAVCLGSPVSRAMEYRASHVGLRHDTATRRLVERCHGAEMVVFVYTANTLADIQRAASLDVDGIISNFPERISRL